VCVCVCVCLQYFDTVGWVFWPVKTVARITYTVLVETLNPALSLSQWPCCFERLLSVAELGMSDLPGLTTLVSWFVMWYYHIQAG